MDLVRSPLNNSCQAYWEIFYKLHDCLVNAHNMCSPECNALLLLMSGCPLLQRIHGGWSTA